MKRFMKLSAVLSVLLTSWAAAQINFDPPSSYEVGDHPFFVFAADLDGDGDIDLVTANNVPFSDNQVTVLLNSGDGTFSNGGIYHLGDPSLPTSVFAGDFDEDGDKDLAVSNDATMNVSILPNNGDGTFQVIGRNYDVGWSPFSVFGGDLDNDGDIDLATANFLTGEFRDVSVLMNNVDGTFHGAVHYTVNPLSSPTSVFASDLDNDGYKDIVISSWGTSKISILPNNGDGTFSVVGRDYSVGETPYSVFATDLDNDGDKDLASANRGGGSISVLENSGNGLFYEAVDYHLNTDCRPFQIFAADLDGDGDKDLITANDNCDKDVSIFVNNGDGTFQSYVIGCELNADFKGSSVTAADLDNDGDIDLAVTSDEASDHNLYILLNQLNPGLGAISGTIKNTNGFPLENARVKVFTIDDFGEYTEFANDTTSASGLYFVNDLYPGRYSLEASRNGYITETRYGVVPDGSIRTINFTLEPAGFIHDSDYVAGDSPQGIAVSDMDNDGDDDMAVVNHNDNNISVYLNNGNGKFQQAVNYGSGDSPMQVASADLDGDDDEDLAITNHDANTISVLFNSGDGTFQAPVSYATGSGPYSISAADLDNDGDVDLAVSNLNSSDLSILENTGNGSFNPPVDYTLGYYPICVRAADLNGDGFDDLAVVNGYPVKVSVLINYKDGTFEPKVDYAVGASAAAVTAADFDGDGDIDLVTANWGSDDISLLKNNGDGTFMSQITYPAGEVPSYVFASDFDGDGSEDLVVSTVGNTGTDSISILMNNGNGIFQPPIIYEVGLGPVFSFASDLDDDGDNDIAIVNSSSDEVSIFLNQSIISGTKDPGKSFQPLQYFISQNYPNPFNPSTRIRYSVQQQSKVCIKIYDVLGNEVATLLNEEKPAGTYELTWNAANKPSGVYFYQMRSGQTVQTRKMILLK